MYHNAQKDNTVRKSNVSKDEQIGWIILGGFALVVLIAVVLVVRHTHIDTSIKGADESQRVNINGNQRNAIKEINE